MIATLGTVPGRGVNPSEDDSFLKFSPDGAYFALEQTFTNTGAHLQIWRGTNGALAYSQASATMATWGAPAASCTSGTCKPPRSTPGTQSAA